MKMKTLSMLVVIFLVASLTVDAQSRNNRNYPIYDPETEYYRAFNESTNGLRTVAQVVRGAANVGTRRNPGVGRAYRFVDRQVQKNGRLPKRYQYGN